MKNSIKTLFGYLILLIESIIFLLIALLLIFKFTLLNKNYVENIFEKNNYYNKLYNEIKTEMSYYTGQSGFDDTILDNIFTEEDVKKASKQFLNSIYTDEKLKIDVSEIEKKLNNNINTYLKDDNFKITNGGEIQKFVKQMSSVYVDEIKLMGYIDSVSSYILKINSSFNMILLILLNSFIVLIFINLKVFRKKHFSVIFYTSSFLLLFLVFYIKNSIDINNISIYSELVSNIMKLLVKNFLNIILITSCSFLGSGLIIDILMKESKNKKHHRKN